MIKTALQIRTIGSILREKRKEKKLELTDIANETKIRLEYLEALEKGNYQIFPSEVYVKGFMKNYARFLGINTEKALAMYRRENESRSGESSINSLDSSKRNPFSLSLTPNKIFIVIVLIAVVLLGIYLGSYVGKVVKEPEITLTSPIFIDNEDESTYRTDANYIQLRGTIEIGAKLFINSQELDTSNFQEFSKEFKLETGNNKYELTAVSQFGREKTLTLNIVRENRQEETVASIKASIEIVNRDATLTIYTDEEKKEDRLFTIGTKLDFEANVSFQINTSKPDAVKLTLNGTLVDLTTPVNRWDIIDGQLIKKQ